MRATAFGLDVEAGFELPGFDSALEPTGRRVAVELADEPPATEGDRIAEEFARLLDQYVEKKYAARP